jgi:cardiolipin synthase
MCKDRHNRARPRPDLLPPLGIGLLMLASCHAPPAPVGGCKPGGLSNPSAVVAEQLLADTAVATATRPVRTTRTVFHDQAAWLRAAGHGLFGKRLAMRLHGRPGPLTECEAPADPALVSGEFEPASIRLYRDGGEALAVLGALIDSATCRIDVLMYTWESDPVGWDIARRLAARAGPDLRVRVLVDGAANLLFAPVPSTGGPGRTSSTGGNASAGELNCVECWLAAQPHVEVVRTRNPLGHFDHRKLVLVDGRAAWLGGRNFTYTSFFERHDLTYTLEGPLTCRLGECFERDWREQGGAPGEALTACAADETAARLVHNTPVEHSLRHALFHAVDHARGHVWLENPYLCDSALVCKLAAARRRGADVRVVMTIQTDTSSINHANRVTANRLLAAGVRVYLYPGRIHTKTAVVDGCWAYMGSGNFDLLSLHRNHEVGVVLAPGPVIAELEETFFRPDLRPEWEMHEPLRLTLHDYAYEMLAVMFL